MSFRNIYFLFFREGSQFAKWNTSNDGINQPLTWFQTTFKTPNLVNKVILLRVTGMNRGHIYLNGYDVGHYWTIIGRCDNPNLFCKNFLSIFCLAFKY